MSAGFENMVVTEDFSKKSFNGVVAKKAKTRNHMDWGQEWMGSKQLRLCIDNKVVYEMK